MPKYLKNKRRRRHKLQTKTIDNIDMISSDEEALSKPAKKEKAQKKEKENDSINEVSSFRILKGKKKAKKIRRLILLGLTLAIIITLLIVSWLSPTGLGELITNFTATFSLKSYWPVELNGTETLNVYTNDSYFYLLSDTEISCISNNGLVSFTDNHGLNSPVMRESEARCLLYDNNGTGIRIYNAKEMVYSANHSNEILTADICRNGYFAIAGKSESYTSSVSVFDIDGKLLYEWNSPEETIIYVAVAPDGESLAVVTVDVENGVFISKLYILKYSSADAVFSKTYNGVLAQGIDSISRDNFTVLFENQCDIIDWETYAVNSYQFDYSFVKIDSNHDYTAIATSRENDAGKSRFYLYNSERKLETSFDFNYKIDDFKLDDNNIFVLSGNTVYLLSSSGKIAKSGNVKFGTVKIVPISSSSCLAVGHNLIDKFELK